MDKVTPEDDATPVEPIDGEAAQPVAANGRRKSLVELDADGSDGRRSSLAEFAAMQEAAFDDKRSNSKSAYLIFAVAVLPALLLLVIGAATDPRNWHPQGIITASQLICLFLFSCGVIITYTSARLPEESTIEDIADFVPSWLCFRQHTIKVLDLM